MWSLGEVWVDLVTCRKNNYKKDQQCDVWNGEDIVLAIHWSGAKETSTTWLWKHVTSKGEVTVKCASQVFLSTDGDDSSEFISWVYAATVGSYLWVVVAVLYI